MALTRKARKGRPNDRRIVLPRSYEVVATISGESMGEYSYAEARRLVTHAARSHVATTMRPVTR